MMGLSDELRLEQSVEDFKTEQMDAHQLEKGWK